MKKRTISLRPKKIVINCPCCNLRGTNFLDKYELNSSQINKAKSIFKFFHYPLFCKNCGHIWNSHQPDVTNIKNYYKNKIPNFVEDYDPLKRIEVIEKIIFSKFKTTNNLSVLDYGANSHLSFHKELKKKVGLLDTLDIEKNKDNYSKKYDLITCYYMLEHALDFNDHLSFFFHSLKPGSFLLIEVPDSRLYANDISGLMYEHQHHFQPSSLNCLVQTLNFKKIYLGKKLSSRNFGFLGIYRKSELEGDKDIKKKFIHGRNKQIQWNEYLYKISKKISKKINSHEKIIFWGINDNYYQIRENIERNSKGKYHNFEVIDVNPEKKNFVFGKDTFILPSQINKNFKKKTFVITASLHWKKILKQIKSEREILIIDPLNQNKRI